MRTVLVGMNNPYSDRPDSALLPYPEKSAGHQLWRMLDDVCPISRRAYRDAFEFANALDATHWDPVAASASGRAKWERWEGRRVVVFGVATLVALWLQRPASGLLWASSRGVTWCHAPHPSGRTLEYNDPLARLAVGLRLEEELRRGMS